MKKTATVKFISGDSFGIGFDNESEFEDFINWYKEGTAKLYDFVIDCNDCLIRNIIDRSMIERLSIVENKPISLQEKLQQYELD